MKESFLTEQKNDLVPTIPSGLLGGLEGPRVKTNSGAHNIEYIRRVYGHPPENFTCSKVCSCMHTVQTYLGVAVRVCSAASEKIQLRYCCNMR